jgi:hypothetical protein
MESKRRFLQDPHGVTSQKTAFFKVIRYFLSAMLPLISVRPAFRRILKTTEMKNMKSRADSMGNAGKLSRKPG